MLKEQLQVKDLETFHHFYSEILLIAPTGAGKTTLLLEYFDKNSCPILYLSPLRALADECFLRLEKEFGSRRVLRLNEEKKLEKFADDLKEDKKRFAVATIENLFDGYLEHLQEICPELLIVFDEIHLFFHWGENFRPILLERYYEARFLNLKLLSLTATLSKEQKETYREFSTFLNEKTLVLDLGNYGLKKEPQKIHYFHHGQKEHLFKAFWRRLQKKKKGETFMIFVAYRQEVDDLVFRIQRAGFACLGCVSGEVPRFKEELDRREQDGKKVDVIVATTCLSHGVNLPPLSNVFLFYPIQHRDFWIQMVGRAGRRGEAFEVFEMNGFDEKGQLRKPHTLKLQSVKNVFLELWG